MKNTPNGTQSPANFPPILHSNSSPYLNPKARHDRKLHRWRTGKPVFVETLGRWRRSEVPETPLLGWKFDEGRDLFGVPANGRTGFRRVSCEAVSARKLAAGMWQLVGEFTSGGCGSGVSSQCGRFDALGFEPAVGNLRTKFPSHPSSRNDGVKIKDWLWSPLTDYRPKHGNVYKDQSSLQSSLRSPKLLMEGATKWGPGYTKRSTEASRLFSDMKISKNQEVAIVPVDYTSQSKLKQAQAQIKELETERQSSKKEVVQFLRKLAEEKASWLRREHQKLRSIVDDLKHELIRERRNYRRMVIVNSKLLDDLADAKLSANRFMQNYEKERKTRELMEEVCNDLAKKIEEDKIEIEELKKESWKIREEVEEERKILQVAEVWREERVQIKLVDAKLILEEKYRQMNNLIADLEAFLRSRDESLDMIEISEAEVMRQAANSVDIQDIKEFTYTPPKWGSIMYSTIEDRQKDQTINRKTDQCVNNSLETVTHNEDQGSSYTPEPSNLTVDRISIDTYISPVVGDSCTGRSFPDGAEREQSTRQDSLKSEISEVSSVLAMQPMNKTSIVSNLWRTCPVDGNVEGSGNLSNSMGIFSAVGELVEDYGGLVRHDLVRQRSSHDLGNPHITRGMKGCIEWPRGIQRYGLKAKLLEEEVECQRTWLRNCI